MSDSLTPHELRRLAVLASVDPRTVRAYLAGKSQRSTVAARVKAALLELGLDDGAGARASGRVPEGQS